METKLTTITPTYRTFVPDQVLTAGQLNEFLNYFDDQDRLSRIFLSGVGIVCGFNINYNQNSNGELVISQGAGITTDGDLIKLSKADSLDPALENIDISELRFTHTRAYDDTNAKYKPFFWKNINGSDTQITLWEAISADNAIPTDQKINSRTDLQNLVVLLYLENYEEDPTACTGIDCENQGIKNIRKLRVLLVSQSDAEYILSNDSVFNANYLISTYLNLDEVALPRVTVNATNSASFATLRSYYLSAMQSENNISKLINGYKNMLAKLGMNTEASYIADKITQLFGTGATYPQLFFQYRYDLLQDLVNGYNELKEMFLDSICGCNPDIKSFPKHLMLGRLIPLQEDRYLKKYRHGFYKSPILKDEKNWCERFKWYVNRTISMLESFDTNLTAGEIRITPSNYRSLVEDKAIPFYYGAGSFSRLIDTWNFDKYKVNKQNRNLSYHTSLLDPSGPIQFPLRYDLEKRNFLRIEGPHGALYQNAMQQINNLKNQYGLAFDVKALGITINPGDTINIEDYECQFEDLQVMLDAWTQEHECLLEKVSKNYSAFSTITLGNNYNIQSYIYPVSSNVIKTTVQGSSASSSNVVKDNLYVGDDSLGALVLPVFDQFRGCSGNDIMVQVDRKIDALNFGIDFKDLVDATLKAPNAVLAHAFVLMNKRPLTLAGVLPSVVESINTTATDLCGAARNTFAKATAVKLSKEVTTMLVNLAQDTTAVCCSAEKLKVIYDEIERRKQEILLGLSLAKFQEQHPGMEHLAGAHQGDTFILVYVRNAVNGIAANTVVADFTLPYLCCSDCRPVGFIMPAVAADLRLSSDMLCVKSNSIGSVDFYKYPADGTIEIVPAISGVYVEGDQILVDSTKLPVDAFGQVLHFKVNGVETNAQLTLYKATEAEMVVPANPLTNTTVNFSVTLPSGSDPSQFSYFWDFGDGYSSNGQSTTHTYTLPLKDGNTTTARVTVSTGKGDMCPITLEHKLEFDIPPVSLCETEATTYIAEQRAAFAEVYPGKEIDPALISDIEKFYTDVSGDTASFLSGTYNEYVGSRIQSFTTSTFNYIVEALSDPTAIDKPAGYADALINIYHNLMRTGLTVVRCQVEATFLHPEIITMIQKMTDQISPDQNPSLKNLGVVSDTLENRDFFDILMRSREKGSASWNYIYELFNVITSK